MKDFKQFREEIDLQEAAIESVEEAVKRNLSGGSKVSHGTHGKGTVVMVARAGGSMVPKDSAIVKFSSGKKTVKIRDLTLHEEVEGMKEEVETIEEGPYSSGQLKPTKDMVDQEKKAVTSRTSTMRARDKKGVYTATMKDGKEVSRVYEEIDAEGVAEEFKKPSSYEIYHTKTNERVHGPFKASDQRDAEIKGDDHLESKGKPGKGLGVRPVKEEAKTQNPYHAGYNAHGEKKTRQHNPYKEGSEGAAMWAKGWEHASDGKPRAKFTNEEVKLAEEKIPVEHAVKSVRSVLGQSSANRFINHLKPGTDKHTTWNKVNGALMKQGVKPKHIADILVHVKPRQFEEVELDEAIEVSHARYLRSHGKQASGGHGNWMFTHKSTGDVDYKNGSEVHAARGSFSDAKKSAQKWAKEHGHRTVYVMESSEEKMLSFLEYSLNESVESEKSKKPVIHTADGVIHVKDHKGETVARFHHTPKGLEYAKQFVKQNKHIWEDAVAEGKKSLYQVVDKDGKKYNYFSFYDATNDGHPRKGREGSTLYKNGVHVGNFILTSDGSALVRPDGSHWTHRWPYTGDDPNMKYDMKEQGVAEGTSSKNPPQSGIYKVHYGRKNSGGYAYYDKPSTRWLMAFSTPELAMAIAKEYLKVANNRSDASVYISNYQGNQVAWTKEQDVAEGSDPFVSNWNKSVASRINKSNLSPDEKKKLFLKLQRSKSATDAELIHQHLDKQGVAEAAKWRRDDLKGKTWRSKDWDDGELSPDMIQIDRSGKDVDDDGDELKARPGAWGGKYKRMTKKGTPTQSELGMQNNLKMRMKTQKKQGGLTGPKGKLPEEVEIEEAKRAPKSTQKDSEKNSLTCPRCGSADVKTYSDGEKKCNSCGNTWDVKK
jgi:hypothetical protein